ncbi:DMT family transporter [Rhizobium sp. L1K21]|uniref:DMT family transporter n=1 Tax=Rhizobium sp. L1K21 TaxID=2954933 RepID=UPI002092A915|nr:DMT family transporter [Rhizobium sp. L1K21]MCO6185487.1 DMT family transporter [Rhizobium sp. L1K21]
MTRIQANLVLLLAGAIWGAGFVAQSTAMETIGPLWFVAFRFLAASLTILPFAIWESRRAETALTRRHKLGFTGVGLALCAGIVSQQYGLLTTSVTNSGFLTGLYVIFVPLLVVILLRRAPHWIIWPASLLSFVGIFLLSGGKLEGFSSGDWLTVLCAFFWAVQVFLIGIFAADSGRPITLSLWQFAITAVISLVFAAALEPVTLEGITGASLEIVYGGVVSSGIAFSLQVIGQRYTTSAQAAIFLSSESLFAALFGITLLGEEIPAIGYLGCACIFIAMIAVELVPELTKPKTARA